MKVSSYSTSLPRKGESEGHSFETSATASKKGKAFERKRKRHGERARFEKAWRGVVREKREQERERDGK